MNFSFLKHTNKLQNGFALYLYTSVKYISDHFSKGWLLLSDMLGVRVSDINKLNKLDQVCPIVIAVICPVMICLVLLIQDIIACNIFTHTKLMP